MRGDEAVWLVTIETVLGLSDSHVARVQNFPETRVVPPVTSAPTVLTKTHVWKCPLKSRREEQALSWNVFPSEWRDVGRPLPSSLPAPPLLQGRVGLHVTPWWGPPNPALAHSPPNASWPLPCSAFTSLIWLRAYTGEKNDMLRVWEWSFTFTLEKLRRSEVAIILRWMFDRQKSEALFQVLQSQIRDVYLPHGVTLAVFQIFSSQ